MPQSSVPYFISSNAGVSQMIVIDMTVRQRRKKGEGTSEKRSSEAEGSSYSDSESPDLPGVLPAVDQGDI